MREALHSRPARLAVGLVLGSVLVLAAGGCDAQDGRELPPPGPDQTTTTSTTTTTAAPTTAATAPVDASTTVFTAPGPPRSAVP